MSGSLCPYSVLQQTKGSLRNGTRLTNSLLEFSTPSYSNWRGRAGSIHITTESILQDAAMADDASHAAVLSTKHRGERWMGTGSELGLVWQESEGKGKGRHQGERRHQGDKGKGKGKGKGEGTKGKGDVPKKATVQRAMAKT